MRVSDRSVLGLIRQWLQAPIIGEDENGRPQPPQGNRSGTPQGGVISPILANLYLHWFDRSFHLANGPYHWANARLVRYADDFVILAKYQTKRLSDWIEAKLEGWLQLQINREKTRIVHVKEGQTLDFLGYSLRYIRDRKGSGDVYLTMEPSAKSQQRYRDRIKELTGSHRNWLPVEELIADINRFQRGWREYFKHGYPACVFGKLSYYTSERVIRHLRRRSQRSYRLDPDQSYYSQLKKLGLQRL